MRVHKPDDEADLIWVDATPSGDWLVQVHQKYADVFFRPKNKGPSRRFKVFAPDHHRRAVLYIKAEMREEYDNL